ncbi:Fanconi anemia core complex-associated protein 100-like [Microtus oregoni]|uniref:Fanconi anemia core complex-associated protein 100-like n=1 Tax=Microtus oregoni TaxID=111838 RepID=UPI001BB292B7|nr:Fanconi anemia core complex-associated protein 100-like [Microtus oregoni]XP_041502339.1 Fanconi anemia core complex-associated protein 100-like [Microtus oregoni]
MAGASPRVHYLSDFCCPLGGRAGGKPHVLRHEAEVFLSTGREFVYVYDQEGGMLTAVFQFPDQVWHLQLLATRRALYVLCARTGIYCLSLDSQSRSVTQACEDEEDEARPFPVIRVDPDACVLPDAALCAFSVLDDMLVTLVQGPTQWKMQLFERPCPGEEPRPGSLLGEVELSTCTPPGGVPEKPAAPSFLPVLCCVFPPDSRAPHDHPEGCGCFMLEEALFGLLFGADATLLQSPVILCGLPDGQLCCVVLKALVTCELAPGDPKVLVKILHHLEEPVVFIGALRAEPHAEEEARELLSDENVHSDCLVALGHQGRTLAIKASWSESGNLVPELREYSLPGPVLCAACGRNGRMYHSTPSNLCVVDMARRDTPWNLEKPDGATGGLPSMLCPASLSICSVVTVCVSTRASTGSTELLALSSKGRLISCVLDLNSEVPVPAKMAVANAGQKIKELLLDIGDVSERVSFLKKAVDQRNKAITSLNEAMNVSCALLSSQDGARPISCTIATSWSRLELRDMLMATCTLENSSSFSLDQGWTLCIQVLTSSSALDLDGAGSAFTYTIPVDRLGPGSRREVTLPLGPSESGMLDLPVTMSCWFYYSLKEVVGGALAPSDPLEVPYLEKLPLNLPKQEGVCLPLCKRTVDMLQCLRFPGVASQPAQAPCVPGSACEPVETFLKACQAPGSEPTGAASLRAKYLPPSTASIRVSAVLLRTALEDGHSGFHLCSATLQWLLAENAAAAVVRAQTLSSIQGVAPDGTDVNLIVREVAVTDLSPAGPIQAVEIQVESSSLANMCRAHHAIIRRMQTMVTEQAAQGSSPPDLRMQYLHQIHANHQELLREVQTLRDQLCTEDEVSSYSIAQKLLQVYRQLRNPSLVLL